MVVTKHSSHMAFLSQFFEKEGAPAPPPAPSLSAKERHALLTGSKVARDTMGQDLLKEMGRKEVAGAKFMGGRKRGGVDMDKVKDDPMFALAKRTVERRNEVLLNPRKMEKIKRKAERRKRRRKRKLKRVLEEELGEETRKRTPPRRHSRSRSRERRREKHRRRHTHTHHDSAAPDRDRVAMLEEMRADGQRRERDHRSKTEALRRTEEREDREQKGEDERRVAQARSEKGIAPRFIRDAQRDSYRHDSLADSLARRKRTRLKGDLDKHDGVI